MFLNSLSPEEKDIFMKLASAIIKADGIVEESEKQILAAYANEMQIPTCDINVEYDVEAAIKKTAESSTVQAKRIIFLELMALSLADGNYNDKEEALMQRIADMFGLDKTFIELAITLEDAYIASYMSLVHFVEKGE